MSDKAGDGYLSVSELKNLVFEFFQDKMSSNEAIEGHKLLDTDCNGKICYDEWQKYVYEIMK